MVIKEREFNDILVRVILKDSPEPKVKDDIAVLPLERPIKASGANSLAHLQLKCILYVPM